MSVLLHVANAAAGSALTLALLVLGVRWAVSPRVCAGTVRHRPTHRPTRPTPAPKRPATAHDVVDLTQAEPARGRTPTTRHPTDQLTAATSTAGFVTHTTPGGTA